MKTQQYHYVNNEFKQTFLDPGFDADQAQIVLAFGDPTIIANEKFFPRLKELYPNAQIVTASSAGEIVNDDVFNETVVITSIQFEKTKVKCSIVKEEKDSFETGKYLMNQLQADDLAAVFVLADGTNTNGEELIKGINNNNPLQIPVTGGMAGDGIRFIKTCIGVNDVPKSGMSAAIGFYGNNITIGHGCYGGWDKFGPEKTVTRSEKNIVYEIGSKNAVDLYNEYLGRVKDELPMNALLFPLALKRAGTDQHLIRTIVLIDEKEKIMQIGGYLPEGSTVQFMKANFQGLINGSSIAAENSISNLVDSKPELALMVSCVGRKLILQKRSDEEVLAAGEIFGKSVPISGFYSYGEFCPLNDATQCDLHNQTMTITTFSEF